jgi:hypothetical protein
MKVLIIGPSGAGKTTLAGQLGPRFNLPVYLLDQIAFTDQQWTIRPLDQKVRAVNEILEQPGWIAEGGHVGWTDPLLEAARLIIWLEIPLLTTLRRRTRGLGGISLIRETPQIWWQVRWYLRPYRQSQDVDRWPSSSAIRHYLRPHMRKVLRYPYNPSVDVVAEAIEKTRAPG